MRIATFNICGWKSAIRKGLVRFIKDYDIDILAIQELRTYDISLPFELHGFFHVFNPSKFHGTAVISRVKPFNIKKKVGLSKFDSEGRFVQLDFKGFTFINAYMPHGRRDGKDIPYKLEAYDSLIDLLSKLIDEGKSTILVGDFNVAREEIDLAKPHENENNTMYTFNEREKLNQILKLGFIDVYRHFHERGGYTWWLRAFNSKERNIGWRIDYIFVSEDLKPFLSDSFVPDLNISDHCPVVAEIKI